MFRSVHVYDIANNEWNPGMAPDLPQIRIHHSCCSLGDFIYISGGKKGCLASNKSPDVYRLNAKKVIHSISGYQADGVSWETLSIPAENLASFTP